MVNIQLSNPFSEETFNLLAELHENLSFDYYLEHSDDFREYVQEPFQKLFQQVISSLPSSIEAYMETKKGIFCRLTEEREKESWDFYYSSISPKGKKNFSSIQLYTYLDYSSLSLGFRILDSKIRKSFLENSQEHKRILTYILGSSLSDSRLNFIASKTGNQKKSKHKAHPLEAKSWLQNPRKTHHQVENILSKKDVLSMSGNDLVQHIKEIFEKLFPLVLLASSKNPIEEICDYLDLLESPSSTQPFYSLKDCARETGFEEKTLTLWLEALKRKKQAIIYGPPGTGKTFLAEKLAQLLSQEDGFFDLVQFHPMYAYEDFIEGIRPQSKGNTIIYPLVPGRFLEFCAKSENLKGNCILLIDEINRSHLERVFGELMYLLEYRGREIILASGNRFRIPENVFLIGTMNTADRSIALVDYALRRRFAFFPLFPSYQVLKCYHKKSAFPVDQLIELLVRLNEEIQDPHYQIGISFFLHKDLHLHLPSIWQTEIEPYLEEYFINQTDKVTLFRWERVSKGLISSTSLSTGKNSFE